MRSSGHVVTWLRGHCEEKVKCKIVFDVLIQQDEEFFDYLLFNLFCLLSKYR